MAELLVVNNALSTLLAGILVGDVACTVQPGDAAKFPVIAGNQFFKVTLENKNTGAFEIVHCTARAAGVLTIVRAQEGTVAQAFPAGSIVSCRATKELLERIGTPVRQSLVILPSVNDLTIPGNIGYQQVSGVTNLNRISTAGRAGGSRLTLKFNNSSVTVAHIAASGGGFAGIALLINAPLVRNAGQTLNLVYDELDNFWFQL